MHCPSCGAVTDLGSVYCNRCGLQLSFPPGYELRRPGVVTALGILNLAGAAFCLLAAAVMSVALAGSKSDRGFTIALVVLYGVFFVVDAAAGVGLLALKSYGRTLQIVLASIGLLVIPVGTLISVLILVYMLKPGVAVLFSGRTIDELTPVERRQLADVGSSSGAVTAIVIVVGLFVGVAFIGIVAAIAIPSLLRARVSANEAAAIGDLRTLISAEAAYASMNGDAYDTLECLAAPTRCLPNYAAAQPAFLDQALAAPGAKSGYERKFYPGPKAAGRSPSSISGFAIVMVPSIRGRTGLRAFCGDASGRICAVADGNSPTVADGACAADCTPLR